MLTSKEKEIHGYIIDQLQERQILVMNWRIFLLLNRVQASWDIAKENQVGSNDLF